MRRPNSPTKADVKRANFDVDADMFGKFQEACKAKLTTPSLVFRHFIKTYVDEFTRDMEMKQQASKAR
ncbi:hypothetical protein VJI72_08875, partial [Parvimonas micra]|uniref:hypothetical protein n=1 Tax=Parvimonas micra TaxID=33033 RepID=UPI002B49BC10